MWRDNLLMYTQIGIISISIILVVFSIFLVSKFQTWFMKNRLLLLALFLFLGLILYAVGYMAKYPHSQIAAILMAVFSTGRMLVLENDFESIAVGVESMPKFSFLFALVMTLSMLTVGMVALSYTGYRALCKIQLGFLKKFTWKKKVFIFSELNESALLLGTDIKLQHKDGIVIYCVPGIEEEEEQLELEKEAAQKGFFVIPMQNELHRELFSLCKHFSKKKLYLFFISKDEIDNISACSDFSEFCKTKKNHLPRINTYFQRLHLMHMEMMII